MDTIKYPIGFPVGELDDQIIYPKDFPIKEFDIKIKELISKNSIEIKERDLTVFLDDLLLNDDSIPLDEFAIKLFDWKNPKLIEKIMMLVDYERMKDNSTEKIVYRKIYK